jgi:hypothetical protein
LIRRDCLALRHDALVFHLELVHPATQYRLADADRAARLHMAIALVEHQARGLPFELCGKRTSLPVVGMLMLANDGIISTANIIYRLKIEITYFSTFITCAQCRMVSCM